MALLTALDAGCDLVSLQALLQRLRLVEAIEVVLQPKLTSPVTARHAKL